MPITALFHRTARDAPMLWAFGQRVRIFVSGEDTAARYSLIEVYAPPRTAGPPLHAHDDCDELVHVLEGGLHAAVNDQARVMRAGDTLIVPRAAVHSIANPFLSPCRFLAHYSPAGFERFLADVGTPGREPLRSPQVSIDPKRLQALAVTHHVRLAGPLT